MDLYSIASDVIDSVNPMIAANISKSNGYTNNAAGKVTPTFAAAFGAQIQKQAMSQRDLQHVDLLNIQGTLVKIWIEGALYGVNRAAGDTGGDHIVIPTLGEDWLVVAVMEVWPDWCSVVGCLQLPGGAP
jgi:hypothetical protein